MTLDKFLNWFDDKDEKPNKLTIYMGEAIRNARVEAGFTQEELAEKIYHRRATLSEYESGKAEPDASTLVLLAYYLKKPLGYFYPSYEYEMIEQEDLSPLENELILHFRDDIVSDYLRKVVIDIVKAIGKFDADSFVVEEYPTIKAKLERRKATKERRDQRRKKKGN